VISLVKFHDLEVLSKILASVLWEKIAVLLVGHLECGATITAKHYVALLDKSKRQLVSKIGGKHS
jgi:NO-binding membrane sensor protein with MHYT domain